MIFIGLYAVLALRLPDGGWDAWSMWNLRAKFIAAGSLRVPSYYAHPDYPPLVPLVIGGLWRIVGVTALVPQVIHGVVFGAILWIMRNSWIAVVFVGAVGLQFAPQQYADTPLALTTLCATVAYMNSRAGWGGLALGTGVLIKNEGTIIAIIFGALWVVRDWRVIIPIFPCVLALLAYKVYVAVPNDVVGAPGIIDRAIDAGRYREVIQRAGYGLLRFGYFAALWLCLVIWLARINVKPSVPLAACALILICYAAIYVVTPLDIEGHIRASWHRLIWHVFPAATYTLLGKTYQAKNEKIAIRGDIRKTQ